MRDVIRWARAKSGQVEEKEGKRRTIKRGAVEPEDLMAHLSKAIIFDK